MSVKIHSRVWLGVLALPFLTVVLLAQEGVRPASDAENPEPESANEEVYRARIVIGGESERIVEQSVLKREVINAADIQELGATDAAQVLEFQSGLELQTELRGQSVRLQGLNPEHALILVNGQRLIGALAGNLNLQRIKSEEIDRIEILKGASSALYGSNAIGGVINIITKTPKYPLRIDFDSSFGVVGSPFRFGEKDFYQDGTENHHFVSISTSERNVKNSFTLGWHQTTRLDLDGQYPNTNLPQSQDVNFSHRLIGITPEKWYLRSEISYRKLTQRQVDFSPPRTIFDRANNTDDVGLVLGAKKYFGKNQRGEFDMSYYLARYRDNVDVDQFQSDELDRRDFSEERLQSGQWLAKIPTLANNTFFVGGEFQLEELISLRLNDGYADRENGALFIQNETTFLTGKTRWYIVPGVRVEQDTRFGQEITPKLAFRWRTARALDVRFSLGQGFRRPTLRNLFLQFQNPGVGYQVIGNPELSPERSLSYNLDFTFRSKKKSSVSVNFFHNELQNLIEFVRLSGIRNGFTTYQVRNLERTYTRGIETVGEWLAGKRVRLRLGYNYTEAVDRQLGIFLEGRSLHRILYGISYTYRRHEFHWNGIVYSAQAVYERGNVSGNPALVDFSNVISEVAGVVFRYPRHTINFRYAYAVSKLYQFYFGIDNLLDQYDVTLNPTRPRYTYIGFRIRYDERD